MTNQVVIADDLKNRIDEWMNSYSNGSVAGLKDKKQAAKAYFEKHGFPHNKMEDWKYTSVRKITDFNYISPTESHGAIDKETFFGYPLTGLDAYYLVFVNGQLNQHLSSFPTEKEGITVESLTNNDNTIISQNLATVAQNSSGFIAMNTALYSNGVLVHLKSGKELDKPLVIYNLAIANDEPLLIQPRNLVVAEENSEVKIVEVFAGSGETPTLTNAVTEIKAAENARVDYSKVQLESGTNFHIGSTEIAQQADSTVDTHVISLDGAFVRNNLHFHMLGKHCKSVLNGLYLLHDGQFLDNHTLVNHLHPECFSDQLYKGIIDDKATGVFNGKVFVERDAQKTNAYQRNVNILLSDEATINTKPQLEIYADDVRCTHGATSGYLDDESIFYFRSRGISEDVARKMLLNAYAAEIINKMPENDLKEPLMALIGAKFK